jgi:hypothetical protein
MRYRPGRMTRMQKLSLDALARELLSRATDGGTSGAASGSRASWEDREGDLLILPDAPHSLTVVKQHSH